MQDGRAVGPSLTPFLIPLAFYIVVHLLGCWTLESVEFFHGTKSTGTSPSKATRFTSRLNFLSFFLRYYPYVGHWSTLQVSLKYGCMVYCTTYTHGCLCIILVTKIIIFHSFYFLGLPSHRATEASQCTVPRLTIPSNRRGY